MRAQLGKRTVEVAAGEFAARVAAAEGVLVDLGCGDGRFAYREARARPGWLCVGVDAVAGNLERTSSRALRKPVRGGAPNLLLAVAAVEALPRELTGVADRLTVNLPWGSLLAGLVRPDAALLAAVAAVGRPGARLSIVFNFSVFEDADYCARMGLPAVGLDYVDRVLVPAYARAAVRVVGRELLAAGAPHRTAWGQRLVRGSRRRLLALEARVGETPR
jgi:16S rRNA (adenine(1408)-N(1))-methyltransferase